MYVVRDLYFVYVFVNECFINNVCYFLIFCFFFIRVRVLIKYVNVINFNRGILKCGFFIYNFVINCFFVMY